MFRRTQRASSISATPLLLQRFGRYSQQQRQQLPDEEDDATQQQQHEDLELSEYARQPFNDDPSSSASPLPLYSFDQDTGVGGKIGRERAQERELAAQFASLHGGWQSNEDSRFDLFVEQKRRQQEFDEFDQRVQRAFNRAVTQHRAEVWNGFKRRLKRTGEKLTPEVLESVNRALSQREAWLRDVFTGIDADYRSGDSERQQRATTDLRACIDGRAGELLLPQYERKLERRFAGPKKQLLMDEEAENDTDSGSLSSSASSSAAALSNEEVNRYASLQPNFAAIEDAVLDKYGRAGREHWDILQAEKDAEYRTKLGDAAAIYEGLLEQQQAYDEAVAERPTKEFVRRISRAQVRFRTAMEIEATREQLVEAHEQMKKQRAAEAEERRISRRKLAMEMMRKFREDGGDGKIPQEGDKGEEGVSAKVRKILQAESLDRLNSQLAEQVAAEKDEARARKRVFMQMVDQLEFEADRAEGESMMTMRMPTTTTSSTAATSSSSSSIAERARLMSDPQIQEALNDATNLAASLKRKTAATATTKTGDNDADVGDDDDVRLSKRALWQVLNQDKWDDPFHTVHAARVQATKTFSEIYSTTAPHKLRLGSQAHRGMADNIVAGEEAKMLQDPHVEYQAFGWGMNHHDIHDLDPDGSRDYYPDHQGWHVRDPKTRDIDLRYEKKLGRGLRWTGPTFYKMGIDAQNHPKDRPMQEDPEGKTRRVVPKID